MIALEKNTCFSPPAPPKASRQPTTPPTHPPLCFRLRELPTADPIARGVNRAALFALRRGVGGGGSLSNPSKPAEAVKACVWLADGVAERWWDSVRIGDDLMSETPLFLSELID